MGFVELELVLLLIKWDGEYESIIFLCKKDCEKEIWIGCCLGVEVVLEILKVDVVFEIEYFDKIFVEKI